METKVCSQCGQAKPLSDYPNRYKKCRACRNEYQRLRKRRIKEEKGIPPPTNTPDDIVNKIDKQGWNMPIINANRIKRRFLLMDSRINKIMEMAGREYPPIPCRECPAKIVAYCAETGTECQNFLRWAGQD